MIRLVNLEVLKTDIHVLYGENETSVNSYLQDILKDDRYYIDLSKKDGYACELFHDENNIYCYYIWTKRKDKFTLIHEMSHIIYFILKTLGIDEKENNELFCYCLEYALREMLS